MILQMLGCLYLSGWLIETVTVIIGLHKHGIKSPTYTLPAHCIAMMGAFPLSPSGRFSGRSIGSNVGCPKKFDRNVVAKLSLVEKNVRETKVNVNENHHHSRLSETDRYDP